jgi:FixJ family two-component response regulator
MRTQHILIAEDEAAMRQSLEIIFEGAGFKASAVSSGEEALRRIVACQNTREPVDLLVTDIQMSEMDGLELMENLIGRGILIPTIVVTGYGDRAMLRRLRRSGCTDFLDKPFSPGDIVAKIRKALDGRSSEENALLAKPKDAKA